MTLIQSFLLQVGLTFFLGALLFGLFVYEARVRKRQIGKSLYIGCLLSMVLLAALEFLSSGLLDPVPRSLRAPITFGAYLSLCFVILKAADLLIVQDYLITKRTLYIPDILRLLIVITGMTLSVLVLLRTVLGVNVLALIALPTVATAVLGFALRDTIARFAAGITLGRLVRTGDWVTLMGKEGQVVSISLGHITIRTRADDYAMLPNNLVTQSEILNHHRPSPIHASIVTAEAHYRHPPLDVVKIMIDAAKAVPGVLPTPEPWCQIKSFNASGIEYRLQFWIDNHKDREQIEGKVLAYVWYVFKRRNIEIPYPHHVVQMTQPPLSESLRETELSSIRAQLATIDFLSVLSGDELNELARDITARTYLPGETVFEQDTVGDECFVISSGDAAVQIRVSGRSADVAALAAGEVFGEMSLLTGEQRSATVRAKTTLTVLVIPKQALSRLLTKNPALVEQFSKMLVDRRSELVVAKEAAERAETSSARRLQQSQLSTRIRKFFGLS
jgi:small-conductance mechanosensitive channel/CRP-like cAMP-binding protein